jgi:hypothetical protein
VSGCARDGRLPGERGAEEQRWREDVVPDGKEVSVTASLVLRLDPSTVENFSYDRHSTWAGSITLVHGLLQGAEDMRAVELDGPYAGEASEHTGQL